MKYRPKNCKKCGGYLQKEGFDLSQYIDIPLTENDVIYPTEPVYDEPVYDRIDEGIIAGIIDPVMGQKYRDTDASSLTTTTTQRKLPAHEILSAATTALRDISGYIERGRQNQFDMQEQTALGMMNPMPTTDYQPNPYSLYAKYGGSLKKYQKGGPKPTLDSTSYYTRKMLSDMDMSNRSTGELKEIFDKKFKRDVDDINRQKLKGEYGYDKNGFSISLTNKEVGIPIALKNYYNNINSLPVIAPSYNMSSLYGILNVPKATSTDSMVYDVNFKGLQNNEPWALRKYNRFEKYGIPKVGPDGGEPDYKIMAMDETTRNSYNDYIKQLENRKKEAVKNIYLPQYPVSKKPEGYKYGGLQHVNYFGPPFSNGANFKFSPNDKLDLKAGRRITSSMIRDWFRLKKGGIHIKPENKGKFTASARAAGMSVQEFAKHVLANKEDYSSLQRRRANFARNAKKFKH